MKKYSLNNNIFYYTCSYGIDYLNLHEVYFIENKEKKSSTKTYLITAFPNSRNLSWHREEITQQLEYITWEELQHEAH